MEVTNAEIVYFTFFVKSSEEVHLNLPSFIFVEILTAIPTQVQCQMLLSVSEKISDKLEQCRLLLLALKKFPNLVKEHGVSFLILH